MNQKFNILSAGITGALGFGLLYFFLYLAFPELCLFLLYVPGLTYSLALSFALTMRSINFLLFLSLSTIEYVLIISLYSKGKTFPFISTYLYGGIGAIIFMLTIHILTQTKFQAVDFFKAFIIGVVTTCWIPLLFPTTTFDPHLQLLAIVLWQISIAFMISRTNKSREDLTESF